MYLSKKVLRKKIYFKKYEMEKMYAIEFKMIANEPYIKIPEFDKFEGQ